MLDDEVARRERADELRRRLREVSDPEPAETPAAEPKDGTSEMLPGESPNEYVQRRMRELDRERHPSG